ncbi:hypothetical protein KCU78_g5982, partial [Aureobasidium melanogenum]
KLSNSSSLSNILQYEYTFQNDGTIWYDLSEVNGNPWDGDWEITSNTASCTPKQQAYRYATDDAYGMQACPFDATITVTLCSGDDDNDSAASSASSSVAVESTSSHSTFSTTVAAPSTVGASASATTLQTSVITSAASSSNSAAVTVTQTAYTTYWDGHHWGRPGKRDGHQHRRHAHGN